MTKMNQVFKTTQTLATLLTCGSIVATASAAQALTLSVEVENISPDGGTYLTPVWVGFHNGSFDSYNGGLSSQPGLERIAEDGNVSQIMMDFLDNLTYIDNSPAMPASATLPAADAGLAQVGTRVDGTVGAAPFGPGTSVMSIFEVTPDDSNRYFSYASMVLPSNDYYVANGDPFAHSLTDLFTGAVSSISFNIGEPGTVNDAGTEINDFDTSAGNGFFPGLPAGQSGPNVGADEGGVNANVMSPFANFANTPEGFDLSSLDFNNYPEAIATVTISVVDDSPVAQTPESVPEPGTVLALVSVFGLAGLGSRKKNI